MRRHAGQAFKCPQEVKRAQAGLLRQVPQSEMDTWIGVDSANGASDAGDYTWLGVLFPARTVSGGVNGSRRKLKAKFLPREISPPRIGNDKTGRRRATSDDNSRTGAADAWGSRAGSRGLRRPRLSSRKYAECSQRNTAVP